MQALAAWIASPLGLSVHVVDTHTHTPYLARCFCRWTGGADGLPREVRLTRFKQLLLEGGVNGFSLYAKVKSKLDKDER